VGTASGPLLIHLNVAPLTFFDGDTIDSISWGVGFFNYFGPVSGYREDRYHMTLGSGANLFSDINNPRIDPLLIGAAFRLGFGAPGDAIGSSHLTGVITPIPEPASLVLIGTGGIGLLLARRRRAA
jgi:hypothetical protein